MTIIIKWYSYSFDCQIEKKDDFQKAPLSFKLYFFLADNTITIKELKENQEGRYNFPLYLRKARVPKNQPTGPGSFLCAQDLRIGEIIDVFGAKFLLTDCDKFTRDYFNGNLKQPQPEKLNTKYNSAVEKSIRRTLPKYMGLGTPEDSLSSTFSLRPRTPVIGNPQSDEILHYTCQLEDTVGAEGRRFILKFDVKKGTISITELPVDNSGIVPGRFVTSQRVPKPNTDPDLPQFYGPSDLMVGQVLMVNCHRFRIIEAGKSVEKFKNKHPEKFTHQNWDFHTEDRPIRKYTYW